MSDQWTAQDQAQLDWVVKYGEPGERAQPVRITPDLSRLDRWDRGEPTPDPQPGDLGIVVMLTVVATLFIAVVIAQAWRWLA